MGDLGHSYTNRIPTESTSDQHEASVTITEPLVSDICHHSSDFNKINVNRLQIQMRKELSRCRSQSQQEGAANLGETLPPILQKSMEVETE